MSDKPLAPGKVKLKFNFSFEGQDKGGTGSLFINDAKAGEAKFDKSAFRGAEGLSVGKDIITTVTDTYKAPFAFTGKLKRITLDFSNPVLGSIK